MAISLDYIGKYVILLVAISVAIGLMMQFSSDISDAIPGLSPGDNDPGGAEVVPVTAGSADAQAERLAELAALCYDRYLENPQEGFTCFIARKDTGTFASIGGDAITNRMEGEAKNMTKVPDGSLGGEQTVIIEYSLSDNAIVIRD